MTNRDLELRVIELEKELELERMRLAACGSAALANTEKSAKSRLPPDSQHYSDSYNLVCMAVDREMAYRKRLERI